MHYREIQPYYSHWQISLQHPLAAMAGQDFQALAQSAAQFLEQHREITLFHPDRVGLLQRARGLSTPAEF